MKERFLDSDEDDDSEEDEYKEGDVLSDEGSIQEEEESEEIEEVKPKGKSIAFGKNRQLPVKSKQILGKRKDLPK